MDAGVTVVQLRDPAATDDEFVRLGRDVAQALRGTGVPLIVNDRVHLVGPIGADGAHIGQGDLDPVLARKLLGPAALLGLSVQTRAARQAGGATRPGRHRLPRGRAGLAAGHQGRCGRPGRSARPAGDRRASQWPCVAIGGITAGRARALRGSGIAGIAVVSAICGQPDVPAAVRPCWGLATSAAHRQVTAPERPNDLARSAPSAVQPPATDQPPAQTIAGNRPATGSRPPVALTIAGSDPSGGAGIQADLKTFSALGAYGTSVITALTAQNTTGVTGIQLIPATFVTEQLQTLVGDVRIDAIKIGMLGTREVADAVAEFLRQPPA